MQNDSLTIQGYPLSPVQTRLWDSTSTVQNAGVWATVAVSGSIELDQLQAALQVVAQRHSSLAMQFQQSALLQYPLQQVAEAPALVCQAYDWQLSPAAEQQDQLSRLLPAWTATTIDQPLEALLIKVAAQQTLLWLKAHPLRIDAASVHTLLKEVSALCNGQSLPSEDGVLPYENYVSWQQEILASPEAGALAYWNEYSTKYFHKALVPCELKKDAEKTLLHRHRLVVPTPVRAALLQQAAEHEVSLRSVLLALFAKFLYAFDKPEQFIIGLTRFERLYKELENAVGPMSKTTPLLVEAQDLLGSRTLAAVLAEKEEELMDWEDFFTFPHAGKDKNDSYAYGYSYLPAALFEPMGATPSFTLTDLYSTAEPFSLQLAVQEHPSELTVDFQYAANRYEAPVLALLAEQWLTFITRAVSLLPAALLEQCTSGPADASAAVKPLTVLELFRAQVARQPHQVAVVYKDQSLSYGQLDADSNALAHLLTTRYHIAAGDTVALLLTRSQWLPVAILAVLKAGAAYVPIDTAYPDTRISQILESGQCKLVLSQLSIWEQKESLCTVEPLLLEDGLLQGLPTHALPTTPALTDLAYLIFTSGSTGRPKGVMITHDSLTNYVQWSNNYYFSGEERGNWGLFTSLAFDLTVTSIYTSLCRGQVLFISDAEKHILSILEEMVSADSALPVDILKLTPSHVAMLKNLNLSKTNVRKVIVGGEALEWDHIHILQKLNPDIEIYNEYGPTEATVGCVVRKVTLADERILIGDPIANTTVCVVDDALQCVGNSCIGELYIGGRCLAEGYMSQPELTQKSFVRLPWDTQNRLWYKTGDLVRQHTTGTFEYLGRIDKQLKIRGYRIEPGEIQAVLLQLPAISNALVGILKQEEESYLVAYLQAQEPVDIAVVKRYLAERVPAYMVPVQWVQVKAFPLTPNGKVDEKALIHVALEEKHAAERPYVAPTNLLQTELQKLWEQILTATPISIQDDFFALGGNSLSFSQLILRVHQAFGKKVNFGQFFEYTTIEQQAAFLSQVEQGAASQRILPTAARPSYPLSPAQHSIWKACQSDSGSIAYNMPTVLTLTGELDLVAFRRAVTSIIDRHENLRTVFRKDQAWVVQQHILPEGAFADLLVVENSAAQGLTESDLKAEVVAEIRAPFDLENGPLMRMKLWQVAPQEYLLAYTVHHIIGDGWSLHVLFNELMLAYSAHAAGQPLALPALAIQYKDYVSWLVEHLDSNSGKALEKYWLGRFESAPPVLNLATDFPRPEQKSFAGKTIKAELSEEAGTALAALGAKQEGTLFMSLMVVLNVVLHKYSGQADIVIGTPLAGREHLDLEAQVGLYVNTLAVRNEFAGEQNAAELYQLVKHNIVQAYSHQLYPFDYLLQKLNRPWEAGRSPLFDVMLVLQNAGDDQKLVKPEKLKITGFDSDLESSKYDLCFFFVEDEGKLIVHLEYDTALYREETMRMLLDNFQHVAIQLNDAEDLSTIALLTSQSEEDENSYFLAQMMSL